MLKIHQRLPQVSNNGFLPPRRRLHLLINGHKRSIQRQPELIELIDTRPLLTTRRGSAPRTPVNTKGEQHLGGLELVTPCVQLLYLMPEFAWI